MCSTNNNDVIDALLVRQMFSIHFYVAFNIIKVIAVFDINENIDFDWCRY